MAWIFHNAWSRPHTIWIIHQLCLHQKSLFTFKLIVDQHCGPIQGPAACRTVIQCSPHKSNFEIHEKYLNYSDLYKPLEESSIETLRCFFVEHSATHEGLELFWEWISELILIVSYLKQESTIVVICMWSMFCIYIANMCTLYAEAGCNFSN